MNTTITPVDTTCTTQTNFRRAKIINPIKKMSREYVRPHVDNYFSKAEIEYINKLAHRKQALKDVLAFFDKSYQKVKTVIQKAF